MPQDAPNSPPAPSAPPPEEFDLRLLLRGLWRNRLPIAAITVLAVLLGGLYAFVLATPRYEARAVISVAGSLKQGRSAPDSTLTSQDILEGLVDRLDLVADPEFNEALRTPGPLSPAGLLRLVFGPPAARSEADIRIAVTEVLADAVTVEGKEGGVFFVTVETRGAGKSAAIANMLADLFLLEEAIWQPDGDFVGDPAARGRAITGTARALKDRTDGLKRELDAVGDAIQALRQAVEATAGSGGTALGRLIQDLPGLDTLSDLPQFALDTSAELAATRKALADIVEAQFENRVLSPAVPPQRKSAPRGSAVLMLSLMLGFFGSGGWFVARDVGRGAFRDPARLEDATGLPVLGQIRQGAGSGASVRQLRTSLAARGAGGGPQALVLTSAAAGDGTDKVGLALAQSFAALGRKVLFVGAGARLRALPRSAPRNLGPLLKGATTLEAAVGRDGGAGVELLLADPGDDSLADLLAGGQAEDFLDRARAAYDLVVVATPPVTESAEARIFGRAADAVLQVVRWNRTPGRAVLEGLRLCRAGQVAVTGLVMSDVGGGA